MVMNSTFVFQIFTKLDFLSQALQLILSLSILITLHEAGHYFPAKWFKVRVEKFFLFFDVPLGPKKDEKDPNSKRKWDGAILKKKKGETLFGLGWIPFGGYVKLGGMIDESNDTDWDHIPENEQFRLKPAWQRLIIMVGGVTVNLVLGFLIYIMVMGVWGETNIPLSNVKEGYAIDQLMTEFGMEPGDEILYFNDSLVPEDAGNLTLGFITNTFKTIKIERGEEQLTVTLPDDFGQMMLDSGVRRPVSPRVKTIVAEVTDGKAAQKAGLKKGDQIISVNAKETKFFDQMVEELKLNLEKDVTLGIIREGETIEKTCEVSKVATLGFSRETAYQQLDTVKIDYSFTESFGAGLRLGKEKLLTYIYTIRYIFSASGIKQMGGFGAIGGMFSTNWNWEGFWIATAFLSLILAFMNILPIPALDGGHVMFLIYEIIRGKAPPQKFMETAQMIGMIFLLVLVLYANGNDVFKWLATKFN